MSQTWIPNTSGELDADDTLSDSRGYINDALEALRSSWSGTSTPASPVAGQFHLDTDDNKLYFYDGATWRYVGVTNVDNFYLLPRTAGSAKALAGDLYMGTHQIKGLSDPTLSTDAVSKNYGDNNYLAKSGGTCTGNIVMGANDITIDHNPDADDEAVRKAYVDLFLPLAGGSGAPMTGDLYMDTHQIKTVGTPSALTDAATKGYIDTKFGTSTGHDHDGTDSKKIPWGNLDTTGAAAGRLIAADGWGGTTVTFGATGYAAVTNISVGSSYTTIATSSALALTAGDKVLVMAAYSIPGMAGSSFFKLQRINGGATDIVAETQVAGEVVTTAYIDTAPSTGSFTYRIVAKQGAGSFDAESASIVAMGVYA